MTENAEALTLAAEGSGGQDSSQAVAVPLHSTKSTAGLPAGNVATFQSLGDVAARVVRDLGRRIGAEYGI